MDLAYSFDLKMCLHFAGYNDIFAAIICVLIHSFCVRLSIGHIYTNKTSHMETYEWGSGVSHKLDRKFSEA